MEPLKSNNQNTKTFQTKSLSNKFSIQLNNRGVNEYTKVSFPVKYGLFSRFETRDYIFEFNLNHEIRHAKSKKKDWLHPSEWLKRTMGNDWVYYSTGGYSGVFEALGEYYLPNLMYPTNSLLGGRPFKENQIDCIVKNWYQIISQLPDTGMPEKFSRWIQSIRQKTPEELHKKAQKLFEISGSRVTVMPPDARHVDYNIIPLTISDGCLYKCRFCKVKNNKKFSIRSRQDIDNQIIQLRKLYNRDIINFNALFLGEHDALNAPCELILNTVQDAYDAFEFQTSIMKKAYLFLFGSVDSFLNTDEILFKTLNGLPFQTFINIGLESYDQATLDLLGKPLNKKQVRHAFEKIQVINNTFPNIEITCNFVMDESLPDSHYEALMTLIRKSVNRPRPKGCVYLSPLKFGSPSRQVLYDFYKLKSLSRFPTFLYIIQRL
ncbi:MAG: radical SAM domain-containing protein [Desulfobacula sp.]|nr:radical SAM domain-containing protein [Desulfobacula sp.]MBT3485732.1 radical SAM domain-containing protein [Desulfobacula sp.]MBT3805153.1 radical SAM domain-containing protein [Desulfobacula sp.]MBT4025542.1 radical SAM domain-containing protein [Desulfobacula sp.]MBT4198941.1 radical SAM domain-containing protein [Desulfobacula sp.]